MNTKKRIFINSVQKELELERAAVEGLISTDPFLLWRAEVALYLSNSKGILQSHPWKLWENLLEYSVSV